MQEINLYHLLKFYAKNWMVILILTTVGVIFGFIYNNFIQVPMYKSDATLILINSADQASTTDTTLINNYIELFKSRRVLEPVINSQGLDISYDDLVNSTDANNSKNTAVINITIATNDPTVSKSLVEGAIISFKKQVKSLYVKDNIQVVDNASFDNSPYNAKPIIQLLLLAVTGFIVSIVSLFFIFDIKINKPEKKTEDSIISLEKAIDKFISVNGDKQNDGNKNESDVIPESDIERRKKTKLAREQWLRTLYSAKRRIKR